MAVLWSGSNFVYGAGARRLGSLGLVLGWPMFMAAIVLTANAWGLLTGEWCVPAASRPLGPLQEILSGSLGEEQSGVVLEWGRDKSLGGYAVGEIKPT